MHNSDFGADEIWCGAAEEWVAQQQMVLHRNRWGTRVTCAVVTVPIVHNDARTQQYVRSASAKSGFRVLWKSGLTWPRSLMGNKCYNRVCCIGRNCSSHSWWRYTPWPGWRLPSSEEYIQRMRACVVMDLACPTHHRRPKALSVLPGTAVRTADKLTGCGGLTDLWWDEHRDTYTGGM